MKIQNHSMNAQTCEKRGNDLQRKGAPRQRVFGKMRKRQRVNGAKRQQKPRARKAYQRQA